MRHPFALSLFLSVIAASLPWKAFAATPVSNDDIKDVSLITTSSFDPRNEKSRGFKEFFSGIGVFFAGPGTDLKKAISDKLDNPALRTYFPDAKDRARLAQQVANEVQNRYLSHGYTNRNVVAALKYATDSLIGTVVKRVLDKEGAKDPARSAAWATKILASFNRCMDLSRSYTEANKCGAPLEADIMKNVGLAMTYEISRQEFGKDSATPRPAEFKKCLRPTEPGADDRVRDCATNSVRRAASSFGRASILAAASKQMPANAAERITERVMPEFDKCLNTAKERNGFVKCGDKLIGLAGAEIASEAIRQDKRIATYFPDAKDRDRMATTGRDSFARCMADNEANNRRDKNGTLLTANCETFVTLETGKLVAVEVFRSTLEKNLPSATKQDRARFLKNSTDVLNQCWDSKKTEADNSACLRKAAKQLAVDVAGERLKKELPAGAEPELREKLLADFGVCLEKRLPKDMITSDGADAAAETCAAEIFRNAAIVVAEAKVRAALQGQINDPAAVDKLITTFVKTDFAQCLGDQPSAKLLDQCSLKLQKNVALQAALAVLPARVDDFFRQGGGLASYEFDETKRKELIDGVINGQKQCLRKEVKSLDPDESAGQINSCFKSSIRDLALRLGTLEFTKAARQNNVDPGTAAFKEVSTDFANGFGACLDKKKDPKFPLSEYLKGLDDCQMEITKSSTTQVAKNELSSIIKQVFDDSGASGDLQRKLFSDFDKCMGAARDAAASDACVSNLKTSATVALAKEGVRSRAIKMLGLPQPPKEITDLEGSLDSCLANKQKNGDDCALDYIRAASKAIGHLELDSQLKPQLRPDRFIALAPEIRKLEESFGQCADATKLPINQKLLDDLNTCGDQLTTAALDFLMLHLADAPGGAIPAEPAPKPAAAAASVNEDQLTDMMTRTFLCLNDSLADGQEQALNNLEPGSMEDNLLKLIGAYVNYDINNAHGQYEEALRQVGEELKAAGPESARHKLLDLLVKKGMVDQLIKGMVRKELEKQLSALPDDKKLPADLSAKLLNKAMLDKALGDDAMAKLRPQMADGVLQPVLVGGKTMQTSSVLRAFRAVRSQALDSLLASPELALNEENRSQILQALKPQIK